MKIYFKTILLGSLLLAGSYFLMNETWWRIGSDHLEVFFGVFGVFYAIVAGFLMLVLLNSYNDIRGHIRAEINALQDLRDYLVYIDGNDEAVAEIKRRIGVYIDSIIRKEWPDMLASHPTNMDTSEELYAIMRAIKAIDPQDADDIEALRRLMDTIDHITTHRTNRLAASTEKLPPLLKPLMISLSMLIIGVFSLLPIEHEVTRMVLNGANIFVIVFFYLIVLDLNNPFKGGWAVKRRPYELLLTTFVAAEPPPPLPVEVVVRSTASRGLRVAGQRSASFAQAQ